MTDKTSSPSELLAIEFLENAKKFNADVELIKVLKSRTYKIGDANVLVRAASKGKKSYFFGINYLTIEEINNLENPFIAFICGSIKQVVIIPAKIFFKYLPQISHDRNGEYKINIDFDLNIILAGGKGNRLDCKEYMNAWNLLLKPPKIKSEERVSVEESLHSIIQGRLIEIGNIRGYKTFCPDKSKKFNDKKLEEITSLHTCPELQFSDHSLLRKIDVLWFSSKGDNFIPKCAFEVELSTGVWSGVGRMATLLDYTDVGLYVIAKDNKKYTQVLNAYSDYKQRYKFIEDLDLGYLYSAEIHLGKLKKDIGL